MKRKEYNRAPSNRREIEESVAEEAFRSSYEDLFSNRYHGAGNHRGATYHALFAALEALEVLVVPVDATVRSEGLEDIDVRTATGQHKYIQLKSNREPLDFGQVGKALTSFAEVLAVDPAATFILTVASGFPAEMGRYVSQSQGLATPPAKLLERARKACKNRVEAQNLLERTTFQVLTLDQLKNLVERAVIQAFELETPVVRLYTSALLLKMSEAAGTRAVIRRTDLEAVRFTVWQAISAGPTSLASQLGLIRPIEYSPDDRVQDFYDGRSARPAHIGADLDIRRPESLGALRRSLQEASVCVILASSGQGKSTLAFRYVRDAERSASAFQVLLCATQEHASSIVEYIRFRLRIGLPLIILIDNLDDRTRSWHRLASDLAGQPVDFIVTSREEDWSRHGNVTAGFTWRSVRPRLELGEARSIFAGLKANDRVASGVRSAEWAFEKVRSSCLLIEYVYLVTKGTLLAERIQGQLRTVALEDPGKIEALRLVSVADLFGARISVDEVLQSVAFHGDPQLTFFSLVGEYIVVEGNDCVGLHPVRSRHISDILNPNGVSGTVAKLIQVLRPNLVHIFVANALAEPSADLDLCTKSLATRSLYEQRPFLKLAWEACNRASQERLVSNNRDVLSDARTLFGNAGPTILSYLGAPIAPMDIGPLLDVFGPEKSAQLTDLRNRLKANVEEQSPDECFVLNFARLPKDGIFRDAGNIVDFVHAALKVQLRESDVRDLLKRIEWRQTIWQLDFQTFCDLALAVQRIEPEEYTAWCRSERIQIEARYKLETRSLSVHRNEGEIIVRFLVDDAGAVNPNEQAVGRLKLLAALFPGADLYSSDPVYPLEPQIEREYNDALKHLSSEVLYQDIDIRVNRAWREAVDRTLLSDGVQSWCDAHIKIHKLARVLCGFVLEITYSRVSGIPLTHGQYANAANSEDEWNLLHPNLPVLPTVDGPDGAEEICQAARDWAHHVGLVVRQGLDFAVHGDDEHNAHLLKVNSRHATKMIAPFYKALTRACTWVGMSWPASSAQVDEDVIRRINTSLRYLDAGQPMVRDARLACESWGIQQEEAVLSTLGEAVTALEPDIAHRVILPSLVLSDYPGSKSSDLPFPAVILGWQLGSLADPLEEIVAVIHFFASSIATFEGFLFVAPIWSGRRLGSAIYRAYCPEIAGIVNGVIEPKTSIFPVQADGLLDPRFDLEVWTPVESSMLISYQESLRTYALALAAYNEGVTMLNPELSDERTLLGILESELQKAVSPTSDLNTQMERLVTFQAPEQARHLWTDVFRSAIAAIERLDAGQGTFMELAAGVLTHFGAYLGEAYRL